MKRRDFITVLGSVAAAWPIAARAQQGERVRRVGVLINLAADDLQSQLRVIAFAQRLSELGWTDGGNVRIDYRWAAGDAGLFQRYAEELLGLAPDVILASAIASVQALQRATRTVPIVFVNVSDPLASGFVQSLARPGGNTTGFMQFEFGLGGKWLELLKQVAQDVTGAAVLRDPHVGSGTTQFAVIQAMAPLLRVEVNPVNVRDPSEIRGAIEALARSPNGGLIITASALAYVHRDLITMLAAQHKLPAVYFDRSFVDAGGLISYGPDPINPYRLAAGYVDRILKGEKPADLPVQAPTRLETVLNLKTARALGLDIPATVLARADEVIE